MPNASITAQNGNAVDKIEIENVRSDADNNGGNSTCNLLKACFFTFSGTRIIAFVFRRMVIVKSELIYRFSLQLCKQYIFILY